LKGPVGKVPQLPNGKKRPPPDPGPAFWAENVPPRTNEPRHNSPPLFGAAILRPSRMKPADGTSGKFPPGLFFPAPNTDTAPIRRTVRFPARPGRFACETAAPTPGHGFLSYLFFTSPPRPPARPWGNGPKKIAVFFFFFPPCFPLKTPGPWVSAETYVVPPSKHRRVGPGPPPA